MEKDKTLPENQLQDIVGGFNPLDILSDTFRFPWQSGGGFAGGGGGVGGGAF